MSKQGDQLLNSFPEKWLKIINKYPDFKDKADSASVDELKKIILDCEGAIYSIEQEMASDSKLLNAKELVKEYSASYRESLKVYKAKIKYVLFLLENKGADLGSKV